MSKVSDGDVGAEDCGCGDSDESGAGTELEDPDTAAGGDGGEERTGGGDEAVAVEEREKSSGGGPELEGEALRWELPDDYVGVD